MLSQALPRTQADFVPSKLFQFPLRPETPAAAAPGLRAQIIPIRESLTQSPGCMRGLRSALLIEAAGAALLYALWELWQVVR